MSKMLEMSFAFSMNVILSMSKMLKIDQIHLRVIMLCMSKMGKEHTHTFLYRVCDMSKMSEMSFTFSLNVILFKSKINQIHLRIVMLCMSKMGKEHTHTFLYRVCDMSKMSEMSFSFSLNVILSMSKMSKMGEEHTHTFLYRVCDMSKMLEMSFSFSLNVILSMLKMSKIGQIQLFAD